MASKTRAQMVTFVIERMAVVAPGVTPAAADTTLVGECYDARYAEMRGRGYADFDDASVPEWAQVPLADLVARDLVTPFGVSGEQLQKIVANEREAWRRIAEQHSSMTPTLPIRAVYM